MYRNCHICRRALGTNERLSHMPVGRRLAFAIERGRLWVICPRCGEWNLTPLDERWEAIEECERVFRGAEVRASSANVGLARTEGLELIRVGPALRDELANWRYGPRLRRRRRRSAIVTTAAGVLGGGLLGGAVLAGLAARSAIVGPYGVALAAGWSLGLARGIGPIAGAPFSFTDWSRRRVRLPQSAVDSIYLRKPPNATERRKLGVFIPLGGNELEYRGDAALALLAAALPRLNWHGATPAQLARATAIVDEAERRAVAGEAAALAGRWKDAEEVAGIADNMFLPAFVGEWIERHRPSRADRPGSPAEPGPNE